jgi:glutamyl-tRNA reductase
VALELVMVGVSHAHAPQEVLERVAIRPADLPAFQEELRERGLEEAVALSTCSRTEVYSVGEPGPSSALRLVELLRSRAGLLRTDVPSVLEVRTGPQVVGHLFSVTAGLESRVVGEADVQAQVRRAYRAARCAGMAGPLLQRLFPAALRSAERAHSRTELGRQGRSLACRAVDIGLSGVAGSASASARTLVVGSGQMATAAVGRLTELGQQVRVAARDEAYAARLAGPGSVCSLDALVDEIRHADLLICATSAAQPLVTAAHVRAAMQGRAAGLTVVDLSVPRNVDPAVAREQRVRLVELAALNDDARDDPVTLAAVREAQDSVRAAVDRFVGDLAAREAGPLIRELREQVLRRCRDELLHRTPQLAPHAVDEAAHSVAGRLLHAPTLALRAAAAAGDGTALRQLARSFGLGA